MKPRDCGGFLGCRGWAGAARRLVRSRVRTKAVRIAPGGLFRLDLRPICAGQLGRDSGRAQIDGLPRKGLGVGDWCRRSKRGATGPRVSDALGGPTCMCSVRVVAYASQTRVSAGRRGVAAEEAALQVLSVDRVRHYQHPA